MDAPTIAMMLAISSSICMNIPPICGMRLAMISAISEDGVIGYPAKKRTPAAIAPSATASLPCIRTIFSLILDLLYCERKVRTMLDTHLAADAVLRVDDCVPVITVYLKDLLRAYGDADTAVFAPLTVCLLYTSDAADDLLCV